MGSAQGTFVQVRGKIMGYYDFNDHFWSPHEACKQKSKIVAQEEESSVVDKLQDWLLNMGYSKIKSSKRENQLKSPK